MGFQMMFMARSDAGVLSTDYNDKLTDHRVIISKQAMSKSRFFSKLQREDMEYVMDNRLMYFSHNDGIPYEMLKYFSEAKYDHLKREFNLIGYSYSGKNEDERRFLAITEHFRYPWYGTQFHPEKTQFERGKHMRFLDRSAVSIRFASDIAYTFSNECRERSGLYKDIPEWIKPHFAASVNPVKTRFASFDSVFILPRYSLK